MQKTQRRNKREIKYLKKEEREKLRDSIYNFRDMVLIELLYESGCRVGEIALMKIEDIDFKAGFIRIPAENTKTKTIRTVYISQGILSRVKAYLKQTRRRKGLLFRLTKRRIQQIVERYSKRSGVDVTCHTFRHTHVVHALMDKIVRGQSPLTILLLVVFCFMSGAGYGEVKGWLLETKTSELEFQLLVAQVRYIMANPESFLRVSYFYDPTGEFAKEFPAGVSTKGKIYAAVFDSRDVFSGKSGAMLWIELGRQGFYVCYFLGHIVSDRDNDIVVGFMDDFGELLGYFCQGEYHLWEE